MEAVLTLKNLRALRSKVKTLDMRTNLTSPGAREQLNSLQEELCYLDDLVTRHWSIELATLLEEVRPLTLSLVEWGEGQCKAVDDKAEPIGKPQIKTFINPRPRQPLKLPTFEGNILKWAGFWKLFSSIIDSGGQRQGQGHADDLADLWSDQLSLPGHPGVEATG